MPLTIINAELVRTLLPMDECIGVMARAMTAASAGTVSIPPRLIAPLTDSNGLFFLMPAASTELAGYGAKMVSLNPGNPAKGLPAVHGVFVLFAKESGVPASIIDAAPLTAIRTAAASGLAAKLLAREGARTCGIFGTGVQAVTHIDAMCAVRSVTEILVWGRDFGKAEAFASEQARRTGRHVSARRDPAEVGACDLICTVTGSPEPILKGAWMKPGAHINLVGAHSLSAREADTDLIVKSAAYVDLMESAMSEAGDLMIPIQEGAVGRDHIVGEIGQVLAGSIPGRKDDAQITVYKSVGIAAQDLYAAWHLYVRTQAQASAIAVEVDF